MYNNRMEILLDLRVEKKDPILNVGKYSKVY